MFAYTGLNLCQCQVLIQHHHAYIMSDIRINVCTKILPRVDDVVHKISNAMTNDTIGNDDS